MRRRINPPATPEEAQEIREEAMRRLRSLSLIAPSPAIDGKSAAGGQEVEKRLDALHER